MWECEIKLWWWLHFFFNNFSGLLHFWGSLEINKLFVPFFLEMISLDFIETIWGVFFLIFRSLRFWALKLDVFPCISSWTLHWITTQRNMGELAVSEYLVMGMFLNQWQLIMLMIKVKKGWFCSSLPLFFPS